MFKNNMKKTLAIVLCAGAILASGCAATHSSAATWEYKTDTTWTENVPNEIAKNEQGGWKFVSMSAVSKAENTVSVVLLFKRQK
jgi:hypothetical protein